MLSKFLNSKVLCIGGVFVFLGIGSSLISNMISTSIANSDVSICTKYVDPYVNYLSLYIPENELKKVTPSGINLWESLYESEEIYEEGVTPMILEDVLIVNKQYGISPDFNKIGVNPDAEKMFLKMKEAAYKDGIYLNAFSTYRSYNRQVVLYNRYVSRDGKSAADRYSAQPGFSEHQSGLAFDICGANSSFAANSGFDSTKEAKWLKDNAYKYGFVLRYPEGCEDETGYMYESWHYRYVGTEVSKKIHESKLSIEKYFGLDEISKLKGYLPQI